MQGYKRPALYMSASLAGTNAMTTYPLAYKTYKTYPQDIAFQDDRQEEAFLYVFAVYL